MIDRPQTKKPFAPIDIDLAVEELARQKNIPTLKSPEPREQMSAPQPATAKSEERASTSPAAAPALSPDTEVAPLGFAPRYVLDQIHAEARRQRSSMRYVVLCALKAQGFEVRDEDLIPDGRRLRGSRTS